MPPAKLRIKVIHKASASTLFIKSPLKLQIKTASMMNRFPFSFMFIYFPQLDSKSLFFTLPYYYLIKFTKIPANRTDPKVTVVNPPTSMVGTIVLVKKSFSSSVFAKT